MDPRIDKIVKFTSPRVAGNCPEFQVIGIPVTMTPILIADVRLAIIAPDAPVAILLVGTHGWVHMASDPSWRNVLDPTTRHEDVLEGRLGAAYGIIILTDAYNPPEQRYLMKDENLMAAFNIEGEVIRVIRIHMR